MPNLRTFTAYRSVRIEPGRLHKNNADESFSKWVHTPGKINHFITVFSPTGYKSIETSRNQLLLPLNLYN